MRTALLLGFVSLLVSAAPAASASEPDDAQWSVTPLYSHSSLSGSRSDWNEFDVGFSYRASTNLSLLADVDHRERFDHDDTSYTLGFSHHLTSAWEWHGAVTVTPAADFSASRIYAVGTEWRPAAHVSLLFDVRELRFNEFGKGTLHEWKPGAIAWFDDTTWLTFQYWHGSGFGNSSYNGRAMRADHLFDNGSRLTLSLSDGVEPDREIAPTAALVKARLGSAFYRFPLTRRMDAIVGFERSVLPGLYGRNTLSAGISARF